MMMIDEVLSLQIEQMYFFISVIFEEEEEEEKEKKRPGNQSSVQQHLGYFFPRC